MSVPRELAHLRRRHEARLAVVHEPPDVDADAELASAWHALQMHWLASVPGYRAEIRERVAEAARHAERRARAVERRQQRVDVDELGREVDGCG